MWAWSQMTCLPDERSPQPALRGGKLFDLSFLEDYVLAYYRIVFFELQFVWSGALVLGGRVIITGIGGGDQFDFISHGKPLVK